VVSEGTAVAVSSSSGSGRAAAVEHGGQGRFSAEHREMLPCITVNHLQNKQPSYDAVRECQGPTCSLTDTRQCHGLMAVTASCMMAALHCTSSHCTRDAADAIQQPAIIQL